METLARPAAVAGMFYPDDPAALHAELRRHLAAAPPVPPEAPPPKMIVVPHAGTVYSGPVAAGAYAWLARTPARWQRVVLLAPAHRVPVRGLAAPTGQRFATPLGEVPLDRDALDAVAALPQVVFDDRPHAREHALEVQLPFLQQVLERFTLVPFVVGEAAPAAVAEVIERLWGGDETLVVVSTDLSHYLAYDEARRVDAATVRRMLAFDATIAPTEACGAAPLNGALAVAARHRLVPRLIDLRNSGDTAGDRRRVVGYASLVYTPSAAEVEEGNGALGAALLARARNAIAAALGAPSAPEPSHPRLAAPGATFVTLRDPQGRLRGCCGRLEPEPGRALDEDVRASAVRAAFEDGRFPPLAPPEWEGLAVEVSLLSPLEAMPVADEADAMARLRPGIDGVVLTFRDRQATFLPQVWAQLPEPAAFLAELKRKAGLAPDFWHPEIALARYRVDKFR